MRRIIRRLGGRASERLRYGIARPRRFYPTYLLSVLVGSGVVKSAGLHTMQLPLVSMGLQVGAPAPDDIASRRFLFDPAARNHR